MNLIVVISIVCITLFSLLGLFLLLTEKGNRTANRFLGAFFLLWAIDFLDGVLLLSGFYLDYPGLALWTEGFLFLYGPLIYFYTKATLFPNNPPKLRSLLHLIPFLVCGLSLIILYQIQSMATKLSILEQVINLEQSWESFLVYLLVYIHFFTYILLSKQLLSKASKDLENYYSNYSFSWLKRLLNALALVLVISLLGTVVQFWGERMAFEISLLVVQLLVGTFLIFIILRALEQPTSMFPTEDRVKYAANALPVKELEKLALRIQKTLEVERLFLDPELNLDQLAETIGSSRRNVSQAINEQLGKSFFELINGLRIDAAKKILSERTDPKLTVLEVMYEVGFNSKSSFNTQFKNRTGLTPTEYLKLKS